MNFKIQSLNENFFYKNWEKIKIKNELINFILPLEDLDDFVQITEMRNRVEEIDVDVLVNKYDEKNYVFVLMNYENKKLSIYLKTNFNNNMISKNISYEVKNINDELILDSILKDLKLIINDLWKEENIVNLLMPLSINLKFQHKNLQNLDNLRNVFYKISIIE